MGDTESFIETDVRHEAACNGNVVMKSKRTLDFGMCPFCLNNRVTRSPRGGSELQLPETGLWDKRVPVQVPRQAGRSERTELKKKPCNCCFCQVIELKISLSG